MKSVTRKLYVVRHVCVNVCRNDAQDMKCGGPPVLGFDFYVDYDEKPVDIREFIKAELAKCDLPCMSISVSREKQERSKSQVWTRAKMASCIKRDGPGMGK